MLPELLYELYASGVWAFYKFLGLLIALALVAQLSWMFYRWVNDAETEWEEKRRENRVFCHKIMKKIDKGARSNYELDFFNRPANFLLVLLLAAVMTAVLGLVWPIVVITATIFGIGFAVRGAVRFKRGVTRVLESKADVNHDHDGRYESRHEKRTDDGAVNL